MKKNSSDDLWDYMQEAYNVDLEDVEYVDAKNISLERTSV